MGVLVEGETRPLLAPLLILTVHTFRHDQVGECVAPSEGNDCL